MEPTAKRKISQGVTTDCVGNCGFSAAPSLKDPERREGLLKKMIRISEMQDLGIRFHTIEEYIQELNTYTKAL